MTCRHALELIQFTPRFPLGPRLSARLIPKPRKASHIMPPYHGRRIITHPRCVGHLASSQISRLSPEHHTAFPRPQCLDDALADLHLVVPAKEVEEARGVYDVDFPLQLVQRSAIFQGVGREEMAFHRFLVSKQIVAQVEEFLLKVACVKVFGRDAVVHEFPYVLREAAAEVQKRVRGFRFLEE